MTYLPLVIILLGIRTALWHLQYWQLREYRFDRIKAYFETQDGWGNLWNLWFFRGILPRPTISGRVLLILFIFAGLSILSIYFFSLISSLFFVVFLLWERTIFLMIGISVFLSKFPVWIAEKRLYSQAKSIIKNSQNIVRIGITGSYGKSSTKEILVHLLTSEFGAENVLFNPANQNNEIAIARLILKNRNFFSNRKLEIANRKFLVCEMGAYRVGEIRKVCDFLQPHIGILTGLNAQHISLFGSQENIQKAKFELAENSSDKVFFNADNQFLNQIFTDKKIRASKIPLSLQSVKNITALLDRTEFELYGQKTVLPWAGEFFVGNALLAAEVAREVGISPKNITSFLSKLPPLSRALSVHTLPSGALLMKDLYSANPDGVLCAIEHLKKGKGKKVFVSLPLLELGNTASLVHQQIFEALRDIQAEVFWMKRDFSEIGKDICGARFHGDDVQMLQKMIQTLSKNDAVLLESRLPQSVLKIFS